MLNACGLIATVSSKALQSSCLDFPTDPEKNYFSGRNHPTLWYELPQECKMAGRQDLAHLFLPGERHGGNQQPGLVKTERKKPCRCLQDAATLFHPCNGSTDHSSGGFAPRRHWATSWPLLHCSLKGPAHLHPQPGQCHLAQSTRC